MPVVLPPGLAVDGYADHEIRPDEPPQFKGYGQKGCCG